MTGVFMSVKRRTRIGGYKTRPMTNKYFPRRSWSSSHINRLKRARATNSVKVTVDLNGGIRRTRRSRAMCSPAILSTKNKSCQMCKLDRQIINNCIHHLPALRWFYEHHTYTPIMLSGLFAKHCSGFVSSGTKNITYCAS